MESKNQTAELDRPKEIAPSSTTIILEGFAEFFGVYSIQIKYFLFGVLFATLFFLPELFVETGLSSPSTLLPECRQPHK